MKPAVFLMLLPAIWSMAAMAGPKTETDTGSMIAHSPSAAIAGARLTDEQQLRFVLREFARCEVDRDAARVRIALSKPAGDDANALGNAAQPYCLSNGAMTMGPGLFRGALFGELYRRSQHPHSTILAKYPPNPLVWLAPAPSAPKEALNNYFMLWMSNCLAKRQPQTASAIVVQPVGSAAQNEAFAQIIADLAPCVPQGQTLKINRAMLEAAFGEYLYRSSSPASQTSAGKTL